MDSCYMKDSLDKGLVFDRSESTTFEVVGYVNSDNADDLDHRQSISSHIFTLRTGAISWKESLQSIAALSTAKAKHVAATKGIKEAIWL